MNWYPLFLKGHNAGDLIRFFLYVNLIRPLAIVKERRYFIKKKLVITRLSQAFEMVKQMNLSGGSRWPWFS
jgi:hypothetical protein